MAIFRDKQSRRFWWILVVLCISCFGFGLLCSTWFSRETQQILTKSRQAMASSMLQQGVTKEVAAEVLTNTDITEQGREFLQDVGITGQTPIWLVSPVWKLFHHSLVIHIGGALLLSVILLWAAYRFLNGRERLYQHAVTVLSRFSEGDYSTFLPANKTGSVYQMFSSVNRLATALQAKSEAEHKAKESLKDAISDISHQLKTPLSALNMYTEIIRDEPENIEVVKQFSEKSRKSLARMEQLVQMLLKVMRLDAGSITFDKKVCRVGELIYKSIDDLTVRAELENKTIVCEGDRQAEIFCDPAWTGEAVGNIVKNALDQTKAGGVIKISWQYSPAMLRLSVADDGGGIAQEDICHIFKRFYRGKKGSDSQGVGLGLPLAKAIVENQGGVLTVQSEPDHSTTFHISFLTES